MTAPRSFTPDVSTSRPARRASPLFSLLLMVEVFKTNVRARRHARQLVARIHAAFGGYRASFDLEDQDRILRVECAAGTVPAPPLIHLLREAGFRAEVLPD